MKYEAWKTILKNQRLPVAVVDLDAFDRNILRIIDFLKGHEHNLRIATKSLRVPELIRRVLSKGAPFKGLMCYSMEEAAFLIQQGFDNVLVAYPTVQDSDLKIFKNLNAQGSEVYLMVDSLEQIDRISEIGETARPFSLVVDIDMSLRLLGGLIHLGVRRSPLRSVSQVCELFEKASQKSGINLVGMMGYEAQVAGVGDKNPYKKFMNPIVKIMHRLSVKRARILRKAILEGLEKLGHNPKIFNGGGTGSLSSTVKESVLTEVTAGSGFYCPHLFDYYSNLNLEPACFFALQVCRSSDSGMLTCQGGGYIASGEPGWDKVPLPYLPKGVKLQSMEGCGEVQTPVSFSGDSIGLGDPILFRHAKAGELAERFNSFLLVSGGKIKEKVNTYRGAGQCFF